MVYIWLFCFSILHFVSTLDWSSYDALFWEVSLWTHLTALFTALYFFKKPDFNHKVFLVIIWLAYLLVWIPKFIPFETLPLNFTVFRLALSFPAIIFAFLLIKKATKPLHKMIYSIAFGIIFIQLIHTAVFSISYLQSERLVVSESTHLIQLAPSNTQAFFDECKKRKISCFKGDSNESLPFETNTPDKIQNHIHQSILNTFKTEAKLQTWAWSDIWYTLPHARTNTYVIHFKTPQAQYLLVDAESLKKPTQNNLFYFSAMTSLGGLVWIVFGGLLIGFHLLKWKAKQKGGKGVV